MSGDARILTERVLTQFANLVYANRKRVYKLWIVAPWIGCSERRTDPLPRLIEGVRERSPDVFLITRPPEEIWHKKAVQLLSESTKLHAYVKPSLHTKLYILQCDGFQAAVFGSPNFTPRANEVNDELAIDIRTTMQDRSDPTARMIDDLLQYALSLRERSDQLELGK